MGKIRLDICAAWVIVALAGPASSGELVAVPHAPLSIVLPDGFEPFDSVAPGFLNASAGAVFSGMQMPDEALSEANELVLQGKMDEIAAQFGLPLTSSVEQIAVGERDYVLLSAQTEMAGSLAEMWMAVSGPEPSFMLSFVQMAGSPSGAAFDRDQVIATLQTIVVDAPLSFDDQARQLGLSLEPVEPFTDNNILGPMIRLGTADNPTSPVIMIHHPHFFAEGQPIEEIGTAQLKIFGKPSVGDRQQTSFAGAVGGREQGTIEADSSVEIYVMYYAYLDGVPLVFIATGAPEDMNSAMIETIDTIAQSIETVEQE